MIFPIICPACHSDSARRTIPLSPEVESFRCGICRHEWSEPAAAVAVLGRESTPKRGRLFQQVRRLIAHP